MRRFIPIPADIISSDWWKRNEVVRTLYFDLSERVAYSSSNDYGVPVGCCYFGRLSFAKEYGYSESKVRTALSVLEKNGAIKVTASHTKSLVEVVYISEYLSSKNDQPNSQPNDQLNDQPNRQPNRQPNNSQNQGIAHNDRQPNDQPNSQPNDQLNDQPNRHKHISSISNIIDNIDEDKSSLSDFASDNASEKVQINYDGLVDYWNTTTNGIFGKLVKPMGDARKKMVRARIATYGKETFIKAIKMAVESNFLKSWKGMSFDWLIKPSNFEKVISGNYANRETVPPNNQSAQLFRNTDNDYSKTKF